MLPQIWRGVIELDNLGVNPKGLKKLHHHIDIRVGLILLSLKW